MRFVDQSRNPVALAKKIGEGGEASVYEIAHNASFVAKIYARPRKGRDAAKLKFMANASTAQLTKIAAWPAGTLHRQSMADVAGVILPRVVDACEIHELYSPAHRRIEFPGVDWRFLIRAARNLAAAMSAIHENDIVIGDVNQGNVFVDESAIAKLIDCDSFQFSINGQCYRCKVGVPHFTPPELQSSKFGEIDRSVNHDHFGLAVLVFHLLFMGRHPFAGRFHGNSDMPIEKAIKEYRFVYGVSAEKHKMSAPPYALPLDCLPLRVSTLFEKAFAKSSEHDGIRPNAVQWVSALDDLERSLKSCSTNKHHWFPPKNADCPWCAIVSQGGPDFFPDDILDATSRVVGVSGHVDVESLWLKTKHVQRPSSEVQSILARTRFNVVPKSPPAAVDDSRFTRTAIGALGLASLGVATLAAFIAPVAALFFYPVAIVCAGSLAYLWKYNPILQYRRSRKRLFDQAKRNLTRIESRITSVVERHEFRFSSAHENLRAAKEELASLDEQKMKELGLMESNAKQRQFEEFLRRQFVSKASIPGIGAARIAVLESYGIHTAFDITSNRIRLVPGFGPKLTKAIVAWRNRVESRFHFHPQQGITNTDRELVEAKYGRQREARERQLREGPELLSLISKDAVREAQSFYTELVGLRHACAQAEADFRACEAVPWW